MPSDLQRVAQGLVDCLDEAPHVVDHLQRTAVRCRENAAVVIGATRGHATTAALQLDAAARACEEAAHYLAMAPPKAKAWADRLVGAARSSNRADPGSADRNKATGGVGDIAERDELGRVRRTSSPLETADEYEPPLIRVARAALRAMRVSKNDRDENQPVEVQIVVASTGEASLVLEHEEVPEELQAVEIEAQGNAAAAELLMTMEEPGKANWRTARVTIEGNRVTADFEYDDAVVRGGDCHP